MTVDKKKKASNKKSKTKPTTPKTVNEPKEKTDERPGVIPTGGGIASDGSTMPPT